MAEFEFDQPYEVGSEQVTIKFQPGARVYVPFYQPFVYGSGSILAPHHGLSVYTKTSPQQSRPLKEPTKGLSLYGPVEVYVDNLVNYRNPKSSVYGKDRPYYHKNKEHKAKVEVIRHKKEVSDGGAGDST